MRIPSLADTDSGASESHIPVLQDLLAEVTVSQTYRNDERTNIEAVCTFPLPLDAVLLELEVDIGGRVLKGVVVEKKAAEEKYEDAVKAGDAAMEDVDLFEIEPPRRALPLELPEPYRRLIELVGADASRLDVAGALDLLTQSGLGAEFDDLFRQASDLGLNVDIVAAMVVAHLLSGPLGEFVSGDAQVALASLQERTREATDALREKGRHAVALARLTQEPVARELLRQPSGDDTLQRLARLRETTEESAWSGRGMGARSRLGNTLKIRFSKPIFQGR